VQWRLTFWLGTVQYILIFGVFSAVSQCVFGFRQVSCWWAHIYKFVWMQFQTLAEVGRALLQPFLS